MYDFLTVPDTSSKSHVRRRFRLDVRVEKRFVFRRWNLDLYLDVQNLYNRKNVYFKLWEDGQQKTIYFLPIIPFIGIQAGF